MSDIIRLLPDSVANQIAAGEVVQRPANVIKELVENSVDAGATQIKIYVVDAGRTSIQVVDNGKGMSVTDARLAFERHATSKIQSADDLFTLQTMGFRGEALPSIAAVSMVDLRTSRPEDNGMGTHLVIEGSRVKRQEPCSAPSGCNIKVENIFFNVPARRKFLKTNSTELSNIISAFERIALVYPQIEFTLTSNGEDLFVLHSGNSHQRIAEIFGKRLSQNLLPVDISTSLCKVSGFVGKPEAAKKKGAQQFLFVNGRFMKHPYFAKAIMAAYERIVPAGEQVPFFVYLEVDPATIDVNIHPAKTEIKFENEQNIWHIIAAAAREAVGVFSELPKIDFDSASRPEIPILNNDVVIPSITQPLDPNYNPFHAVEKAQSNRSFGSHTARQYRQPVLNGWEEFYATPANTTELYSSSAMNLALSDGQLMQFQGQYILAPSNQGLLLIDQHRAHVRILYNKYIEQIAQSKPLSQRLLFPEAVQVDCPNSHILDTIVAEMEQLGFEISPLGAGNYAINAVPAGLDKLNPSALVSDMIDDTLEAGTTAIDEIPHQLALTLARRAAIPRGQPLSDDEVKGLTQRLFAGADHAYTPNGKKVYFLVSEALIAQHLG